LALNNYKQIKKEDVKNEQETLEKHLPGNDGCTVDADWVRICHNGPGSRVRMEMARAKLE
jgi:hypothetical protein